MDTDVALAEMELLEQNQKRLSNLTSRMTTILNGFDKRLAKLESSILPIHQSTQQLALISSNVEATTRELERSLLHYGVVVEEEPQILRGPSPRDPWPYLEAILRVARGMHTSDGRGAQNPEQVLSKRGTLVELGARNVADLLRDFAQAESRPTDVPAFLQSGHPLPGLSKECLTSIKALLQFLSTLDAVPSGSPSPFLQGLSQLAGVRRAYCTASLAPLVERVSAAARVAQNPSAHAPREVHVAYERGAAGIQAWLESLVALLENERQLFLALFEGMQWSSSFTHTYTQVVQPVLSAVSALLPTLLPRLQHGLNVHRFFLLDFVGSSELVLGAEDERWRAVLADTDNLSDDFTPVIRQSREHALQGLAEFLRDIKVIPVQREYDTLRVEISDIARVGAQLVKSVAEYQDVITALFQSVPMKTWVEAESAAPRPVGSGGGEGLWVEYVFDLVATIVGSLERVVANVTDKTLASVFWLNNVAYLQQEIASINLGPAASSLDHMLSLSLQSARALYLDSWSDVVETLGDGGSSLARGSALRRLGPPSNSGVQGEVPRFLEQLREKQRIHRTYAFALTSRALHDAVRQDVVR